MKHRGVRRRRPAPLKSFFPSGEMWASWKVPLSMMSPFLPLRSYHARSRLAACPPAKISLPSLERENAEAPLSFPADLLGDGQHIPCQFQFLLIEGLGHQIPAVDEQQVSAGVLGAVIRVHQSCVLLRIERTQRQYFLPPPWLSGLKLKKDEVPSIGQKRLASAGNRDRRTRLLVANRA